MKSNEQRPDRQKPIQGELSFEAQSKDTPKLSRRQKKVLELLKTHKHSVADITIRLGYCDPRSYVRDLREKGVTIHDEWVENKDTRYKLYWV